MICFRKEERDLIQEIASAPPGIYVDDSDSDDSEESTDSNCISIDSQTPTCDCSFIDTIPDGKSLPSQSFVGYMMILKGYTLLRRTFKVLPRNPETTQSRKMQHRFTQAFKPTKASAPFCTASTTVHKTYAPGPSVEHHPLSTDMARPNVTDSDPLPALSLSSRFIECNHPMPNSAPLLSSTASGKWKAENERPLDTDDENLDSRRVSHFPRGRTSITSVPSGDAKAPSVFEVRSNEEQFTSDVEKSNIFPHTPAVDSIRLHSLPMEHPGPSPEQVAFKFDERHVRMSSNQVPPLPLSFPTPFSAMDGTNLLANNNFPSHTFIFLAPRVAFNSHPFAFQNSLGQAPLAWSSVPASSGPSLGYNGLATNLTTFTGPSLEPYNYDTPTIPPNVIDTHFAMNCDMQADGDQPR